MLTRNTILSEVIDCKKLYELINQPHINKYLLKAFVTNCINFDFWV